MTTNAPVQKQAIKPTTSRAATRRKWYEGAIFISFFGTVALVCMLASQISFLSSSTSTEASWTEWHSARWAAAIFNTVIYAFGMEYYARYFHRVLWHGPWYVIHKTHHEKHLLKDSKFELNDLFGMANFFLVMPCVALGFFYPRPCIGSCALLGMAAGISIFGTSYMLIHDGLHHHRFGSDELQRWIRNNAPYLQKVADAHAMHHTSNMGPPYGLFLGPHECESYERGVPPKPIPFWLQVSLVLGFVLIIFTRWP